MYNCIRLNVKTNLAINQVLTPFLVKTRQREGTCACLYENMWGRPVTEPPHGFLSCICLLGSLHVLLVIILSAPCFIYWSSWRYFFCRSPPPENPTNVFSSQPPPPHPPFADPVLNTGKFELALHEGKNSP